VRKVEKNKKIFSPVDRGNIQLMIENVESVFQALRTDSYLFSGNGAYLEALYEQYLHDPNQMSREWQTYFNQLVGEKKDVSHADIRAYFLELANHPPRVASTEKSGDKALLREKVHHLIEAYRRYGHYQSNIDPLKIAPKREIIELNPENHALTVQDLLIL
jgi:2-oxoglutarate dehydrogenase E1 component